MRKTRAKKSLYASAAPPPTVSIRGAGKKISMADMKQEYNGLLAMFAVVMEANNGKLLIDNDTLKKVTKEGRTIQIVPGTLGYTFQFYTPEEPSVEEQVEEVTEPTKDFLGSATAAEAREYLAQQKREEENGNQD